MLHTRKCLDHGILLVKQSLQGFSEKGLCLLQLDPPDSQLLYMRGASVNFLFDAAFTLSYAQQGRYQHILHDAVDKLDRGIVK